MAPKNKQEKTLKTDTTEKPVRTTTSKVQEEQVKEEKMTINNSKIIMGLLLFLCLCIIALLTYGLYNVWKKPDSVARYLPKADTIAFISLDIREDKNTLSLLQPSIISGSGTLISGSGSLLPTISNKNVIAFIEKNNFLSPDFFKELQGSTATQLSLGLLHRASSKNLDKVFFLDYTDKKQAEEWLQNDWSKDSALGNTMYKDHAIFSQNGINQNDQALQYASFIGKYIVLSQYEDIIKKIADIYEDKSNALISEEKWIQIQKNISSSAKGNWYVNIEKSYEIAQTSTESSKFFRDIMLLLKPLANNTKSMGGTLVQDEQGNKNGIKVTLVSFGNATFWKPLSLLERKNPENTTGENTIGVIEMYEPFELLGALLDQISVESPDREIILRSMLYYAIKTYFGNEFDLHVAKQVTGSTCQSLWQQADTIGGIILSCDIRNETEAKQYGAQILDAFGKQSTLLYTPQIKEMILPDGTRGQEIVLSPRAKEMREEMMEDYKLSFLATDHSLFSPGYSIMDGKLYLFSHESIMRSWIEDGESRKKPNVILKNDKHHVSGIFDFEATKNSDSKIQSMEFSIDFFEQGPWMEIFIGL